MRSAVSCGGGPRRRDGASWRTYSVGSAAPGPQPSYSSRPRSKACVEQAKELAEHLILRIRRPHHARVMLDEIKLPTAAAAAEPLRPARQAPRHRLIVPRQTPCRRQRGHRWVMVHAFCRGYAFQYYFITSIEELSAAMLLASDQPAPVLEHKNRRPIPVFPHLRPLRKARPACTGRPRCFGARMRAAYCLGRRHRRRDDAAVERVVREHDRANLFARSWSPAIARRECSRRSRS